MATRSYIFVSEEKFTGQVKGIYCHWDGYVEGVGKTLKEHYNTYELANALINLGDISSLEETLEKTEDEIINKGDYIVCSLADFLKNLTKNGTDIEFIYLYVNSKWLFAERTYKEFSEFKEV